MLAQMDAGGTAACPVVVPRPAMLHDWRDVTFLHWPCEPSVLQALLPRGLVVDTHSGTGWVGLVPFVLSVWTGSGALGSRFPETNVRTYVRGPDGVPGVWFLSLDAARTDAVLAARVTHRLPYMRARMTVAIDGSDIRYRSRRRWPHAPAGLDSSIRVGAPIRPIDISSRDAFLTARYCLYTHTPRGVRRAWAAHEPWPLHTADVLGLREDLLAAAGIPATARPPIAHYSPGVTVRVGQLEVVQAARATA